MKEAMIVSDSTTIIILSNLDRFDLLSKLFTEIIIPQAVYQELNTKISTELPSFITIKKIKPSKVFDDIISLLDTGESEAISLAIELGTGLIIDEKKGRKIAINKGVRIIGLLGIIYLNIQRGFISKNQAKIFLDLAIENGFRISPILIKNMFDKLKE